MRALLAAALAVAVAQTARSARDARKEIAGVAHPRHLTEQRTKNNGQKWNTLWMSSPIQQRKRGQGSDDTKRSAVTLRTSRQL